MTCLHCGRDPIRAYRVPATRIAKRVERMNPNGWYYFGFCELCQLLEPREYHGLWVTYPDRLAHHSERLTHSEALAHVRSN